MAEYPAADIEVRWQRYWAEHKSYRTPDLPRRKYYVLEMFLYPSGDMHMGHVRNYAIGDVVYRYRRMQGFDVLHPFGWDAFGLPAENAAIKHKNHPRIWTMASIETCRSSLQRLGISYDWEREVTTCNPDYYHWNQWFFLKFFERGLAYRKEAFVNWCTGCQTVLANEQVEEGECYRCRSVVEKRKLAQWFLRITEYAQRLLDGLDALPGWPENVKIMQRNWIGRSQGCEVDFELAESPGERVPIFTTRPDTLYGVTFMALAPDAPMAETIAQGTSREAEVRAFCQEVLKRPEIERIAQAGEKFGCFTGKHAINPLTGERVPIYIADFVLATYGTGMIMAVPAHDQRDFEFARKYGIPLKVVIQPPGETLVPERMTEAYTEPGEMVNSGQFDGISSTLGIERITDYLVSRGLGRRVVNYRLKDWLVSRQRYWGTPIPMIHCARCGTVPVPLTQLPVLLPQEVTDFAPKGKSVLAGVESFCQTSCPSCAGPAVRDPDTMDTFVDSSWYYLRYTDAHNEQLPFAPEKANAWLPIDDYIGGIEHACGHLIFFRFFHKVLHDMGMVATEEPSLRLHTHGLVHLEGRVMSSSKKIGIWASDFLKEYGADAARLAVLFAAPPDKGMDWQEDTPVGVSRFLGRIYRLFQEHRSRVGSVNLSRQSLDLVEDRLYIRMNQTIKRVSEDLEGFQFNTAIAALMEFFNELTAFEQKSSPVFGLGLHNFLLMLASFAPHLAEELWALTGHEPTIMDEPFPKWDPGALEFERIEIPVQVNGRLRTVLEVPRSLDADALERLALADPKVKEFCEGKQVKKVVNVKGRLINVVTG